MMMNSSERLGAWLHSLLELFAHLDESDDQALAGSLEDLRPPCQVDAVWFAVPGMKVDCQIFVFSRFTDMEHGLVTVHGPAHPSQASEMLNALSTQPKWQRPIAGRLMFALKDPSYARLLEMPISQALANIKGAVLTLAFQQAAEPPSPRRGSAGRLTDEAFYWICAGNLAEQPAEDVAEDILEEARKRALSAKRAPERPAQAEPSTEPGFGTYLYPPVWIGALPVETTEQRLHRSFQGQPPMGMSLLADEAVTSAHRGTAVVVMQNGFVAIKEANRQKALAELNEVIAAFLLSGLPSYAARDHELSEVEFEGDRVTRRNEPITSMRMAWGTGSLARFETPESLEWTRTILSTEDVRQVFDAAERLSFAHIPSLLFFLESYTAFRNSEFPQSYVMSWAVLEDWISAKWRSFLAGRDVRGKRRDKLFDHRAWTVDHYLETLNLAGEMNITEYSAFMSLKSKRNLLLHERTLPTTEDAATALRTAESLLQQLLPVEITPFLGEQRLHRARLFTARGAL